MQLITKNYHKLRKLDTNKDLNNTYLQNNQTVTETGAFMYRGTVHVHYTTGSGHLDFNYLVYRQVL
jgi:hypothetical protein